MTKEIRKCIDCEDKFPVYHTRQIRCKTHQLRYRNTKKKSYNKDCSTCGKLYHPTNNRSKLCPECMEELTCGVCLKRVKRTGLGQKYCSPRCRNIIKTSVKRGPNYLETLRRDSITCQKCGEENTVIHVHHIDGFGTGHPDNKQNNSLNNLITLCNSCHMQAHRLITRRLWEAHTTEVLDQFAKFMK